MWRSDVENNRTPLRITLSTMRERVRFNNYNVSTCIIYIDTIINIWGRYTVIMSIHRVWFQQKKKIPNELSFYTRNILQRTYLFMIFVCCVMYILFCFVSYLVELTIGTYSFTLQSVICISTPFLLLPCQKLVF